MNRKAKSLPKSIKAKSSSNFCKKAHIAPQGIELTPMSVKYFKLTKFPSKIYHLSYEVNIKEESVILIILFLKKTWEHSNKIIERIPTLN